MAHKIIRAGYYQPTLFRDAHAYVRKCEPFQRCARKVKRTAFPLEQVAVQIPFQQWGLDFFKHINPMSSLQHKYILTATDYFTRCNTNQVISFLENQIVTRFGTAEYLIFYNASYFTSIDLTSYALEKGIKLKFSSNYYPQGNGLT